MHLWQGGSGAKGAPKGNQASWPSPQPTPCPLPSLVASSALNLLPPLLQGPLPPDSLCYPSSEARLPLIPVHMYDPCCHPSSQPRLRHNVAYAAAAAYGETDAIWQLQLRRVAAPAIPNGRGDVAGHGAASACAPSCCCSPLPRGRGRGNLSCFAPAHGCPLRASPLRWEPSLGGRLSCSDRGRPYPSKHDLSSIASQAVTGERSQDGF